MPIHDSLDRAKYSPTTEGQELNQTIEEETNIQENDGQFEVVACNGEEDTNTHEDESQFDDVPYGGDFPFVDDESDSSGGEEIDDKDRQRVRPIGNTFKNCKKVLPTAYSNMEAHYTGPWISWNKVPPATKDLWFDEFANEFFWKDRHAESVRRNWAYKCGEHLRYILRIAREKGRKPPFVKQTDWNKMLKEWATEKWKRLSESNKNHRACQKAVYTGGSKNTHEHATDFKKKNNKRMTQEDLIKLTCRKKKTREWTGPKPQAIIDRFIDLCNEFKEEHPEGMTKEDSRRLWAQAARNKKGHLFAQGSLNKPVREYRNPAAHNRSSQRMMYLDTNQMADLRKSIEEDVRKSIEEDLRKSISAELQKTMDDKIQQMQARHQETLAMHVQRAQFQQMQRFAQTFSAPTYVDLAQQTEPSFMALLNSTGQPTAFPSVSIGPSVNCPLPPGHNMGGQP